jgi:phosphoglycerate dehydrogenase-like enzyme
MKLLKGLYVLGEGAFEGIYSLRERGQIGRLVDIFAPLLTADMVAENPAILDEADVIFSGWGCPKFDSSLLSAASQLKIIFYGAGSIRSVVTEEFWNSGLRITSAYAANAIPVTEYTLSQILFSLKLGWHHALAIKRDGKYPQKNIVPGAYGGTVGIISLGMIGRGVCELLRGFDVNVIAFDPYAEKDVEEKLNIQLCSLEEVFSTSDVVSLHTPWLPQTEGMIKGIHFEMMKTNASFINTARGAIVREAEMTDILRKRSDIFAILDVTYPEPPLPESPLYTLPNVILTPHIAGSMDRECNRMGKFMADELIRFLNGEKLLWEIDREKAALMA